MNRYILVIDTETANTIEQPLCYDIGYAICDMVKKSIVLERSYICKEIFIDEKYHLKNDELMASAYYADKVPMYFEERNKGERIQDRLLAIRKQLWQDMRDFGITEVYAYNINFDKRALNNTIRYSTDSFLRWFFPANTAYNCIWSMACETILSTKDYIETALKNGWVSDKDNILTNAEKCYTYIKNEDFKEAHTGLEDVKIEFEILLECINRNPNADSTPRSWCWRDVQKARAELI